MKLPPGMARQRRVVGEKLQRHDVQDRRKLAVVFGQTDDVHAFRVVDLAVAVRKDVEFAPAGSNFLHVGFQLLQEPVVRRHRHDGHFLVNQSEWPVFEFSGGISLGMNVADFLELQSPFECDRVVKAATEEECVLLRGEALRPVDHLRLEREHGAERGRNVTQTLQFGLFVGGREAPAQLRERKREQVEKRGRSVLWRRRLAVRQNHIIQRF